MKRTCRYHSRRWAELVEQGWVTMFVIECGGERLAVMLNDGRRR